MSNVENRYLENTNTFHKSMELAFFNGHQDMISSYYKCLQSAGNWCTLIVLVTS